MEYVLLALSLLLTIQALFSIQLMLYTWEDTERAVKSRPPTDFLQPHLSFSILLPAREEQAVIYETIQRVWAVNYPKELIEINVICHESDTGTLAEAQRAARDIRSPRVKILSYTGTPINKQHGLNYGMRFSTGDVVTIFDAEDDISPDILTVVNTIMLREDTDIVQGGVQLMNYRDHWFSLQNCLEYFFWFKSRLHFHSQVGMIPLGGNTVFFARHLIEAVNGWDERCLTEDADIGLRLSALAKPVRVFYDPRFATREETPDSIKQFIKQRTRWHQGFLQVLRKGDWLRLPKPRQRLLAFYSLAYPLFQAFVLLLFPITLALAFFEKLPVWIALFTIVPLYTLLFQLLLTVYGVIAFTRDFGLKISIWDITNVIITFIPYQLLQGISAFRAIGREARGVNNWEKTAHAGAHR